VIWPVSSIFSTKSIRKLVSDRYGFVPSTRGLKLVVLGLVLGVLFGGCQKSAKRLPAANIHAATREFASAASAATPGAEIRTELRASDEDSESADQLDIKVHGDSADGGGRAAMTRLLQVLGSVATRHGLTQDAQSQTGEGILFNYSHAGFATHAIRIQVIAASAAPETPPPAKGTETANARLAIVLDDLGNDRAAANVIFGLPYPLTVSVLPNRPHSVDIAEEAHRRGYQVMLHLPMESLGNGKAESRQLRPGMSAKDVSVLVSQFLRGVPDAAGVNNHQGSESTANAALMAELMPVLREHKLFYIDSRTTVATVAYDAARNAGVPAAFRSVPFLDDVAEVSAVRKQLQQALRDARERGEAVAIGHPHPATLKALSEVLPEAKGQGVRLVFASDLVH
jgi:uncharacterized protein